MSTTNRKTEAPYVIFHTHGNGSNDGSVLANKTFHVVYYILKHDFHSKTKTIIGILFNKNDGDPYNKLYFNCIMPLSETFSIPYLIKNIIYKPTYNKYLIKKALTEDKELAPILKYAEEVLDKKVDAKLIV